jgi:outer membrane protein TolC
MFYSPYMAFRFQTIYFFVMKIKAVLCCVFALGVLSGAAAAQTADESRPTGTAYPAGTARVLTVDEAVRAALDSNLSLQRNAIDLGGKKRASDRSWNSLIPSVSASAVASHPTSLTGEIPSQQDIWTPGFQVAASVNLSVATMANISKARSEYEAGLLSYEQARQELELQVRKLFYQILLLDANRELAAQTLESARLRYKQSAALSAAGQAPKLDELSARVDLENQKPAVRSAQISYENALDSLKTALGIPHEETVVLEGSLESALGNTVRYDGQKGDTPETAALRKSIQALEAQKKAAQDSAYLPSLNLSWRTNPLYSSNSKTWNDSGSFSVSLGIALDNFLPWSPAKTQIDSLDDSIRSSRLKLSETLRNREDRIEQYRRTIEKTLETIEALKLNVELARTAYNLYTDAYRKGAADYQQLRSAGDSLSQAENKVLQEQYNLISAILDLEKEQAPSGAL